MKKILFVSHEYSTNGASFSLLSLIEGMKKNYSEKVEIIVLIPWNFGKETKAKELFLTNGVKCIQMLYRNNFKFKGRKKTIMKYIHDIWNGIAVGKLGYYIAKNKIDLICSNSSAVDVGARAALIKKIPHIYYVREFMEEDFGIEYRNKKRMKKLLESSAYVIFISKAIAKKYQSLYKLKNTAQFFNGFILQNYYIKEHDILKKEKISLVQIGIFSEAKGTINTLRLLRELKKNGVSNWCMEFVGNGEKEYVEKMQELIMEYQLETQITISEFCSDIKKKLSQKDILIMNSRAEGFGRTTVEGMLAGCLVIGKYAGGTTEIIIDGVNGITFQTKEEFLNIMQDVIAERKKYRELAKKGQKYAQDNFDCTITAKNFMGVVNECL